MAELSNLLGAVYGDGATTQRDPDGPPIPVEPPAAERGPAVPDWADDDDRYEPPLEPRRAAVAELSAAAGPLPLAPPPPADVQPAEEHGDDELAVAAVPSTPSVPRTWDRSDDDILPGRRRGFLSLSLRR